MTYFTGFVSAVPTANKQAYIDSCHSTWPHLKKYGALRMVECWGDNIPHGKQTDFYRAVEAKDDEIPVFSWIVWPDRATAQKAFKALETDKNMPQPGDLPFDGSRTIMGGFDPVYEFGTSEPGRYVQGFVLAAPADKKDAYIAMAKSAEDMFKGYGALHSAENWGDDVPHGKKTDFYRAAKAVEGEVPLFSWIEWPDRATYDEASRQMEADMPDMPQPTEMPFDGARMFWGGFTPIVDVH